MSGANKLVIRICRDFKTGITAGNPPLSAKTDYSRPQSADGIFVFSWPNQVCLNEDRLKQKYHMSGANKLVIRICRDFKTGITAGNPPLSASAHHSPDYSGRQRVSQ